MLGAMPTGYEHLSEQELLDPPEPVRARCRQDRADARAAGGVQHRGKPSRWARSSTTPTSRPPSTGPSRPAASAIRDPLLRRGQGEERALDEPGPSPATPAPEGRNILRRAGITRSMYEASCSGAAGRRTSLARRWAVDLEQPWTLAALVGPRMMPSSGERGAGVGVVLPVADGWRRILQMLTGKDAHPAGTRLVLRVAVDVLRYPDSTVALVGHRAPRALCRSRTELRFALPCA